MFRTKDQLIQMLTGVGFDEKRLRSEELSESYSTKDTAISLITERYHHLPTELQSTEEILNYLGFVDKIMPEEFFLDFAERKFADLPEDDCPHDVFLRTAPANNQFVRVPGVRVPVMMASINTDPRELERLIHRRFGRTCHGPAGQPPL
jgi:hypothetical protein